MERTAAYRWGAMIITAAAVIIFCMTLARAVWYAPDGSQSLPLSQASASGDPAATSTRPARLIIPALNIDANVQYVGLTAAGNMGTPNNFTDVAWYDEGPVPGQVGSAVVDGHVDNGLSLPGVFKHLGDIAVGDDIYVEDTDGSEEHFIVRNIKDYPYQQVPTSVVFDQSDQPRLNLITCEGTWVPGGKTYDHRLVIFTTLAS